jgi:hypothetical protein
VEHDGREQPSPEPSEQRAGESARPRYRPLLDTFEARRTVEDPEAVHPAARAQVREDQGQRADVLEAVDREVPPMTRLTRSARGRSCTTPAP